MKVSIRQIFLSEKINYKRWKIVKIISHGNNKNSFMKMVQRCEKLVARELGLNFLMNEP